MQFQLFLAQKFKVLFTLILDEILEIIAILSQKFKS